MYKIMYYLYWFNFDDFLHIFLRLTAEKSKKRYLSSGTQQDAEEFLRSLLDVLEAELEGHENFKKVMGELIGKEREHKKFMNSPSGRCLVCNNFPSLVEQEFLT